MPNHRLELRLTDEELAWLDGQRGLVPRATWIKAISLTPPVQESVAKTATLPSRTGKGARPSTEPAPVKKPVPSIDGYLPCETHPDAGVKYNDRIHEVVCGQCNCLVKKS